MVVEKPRHERTHDEVAALKGLVRRRRLVNLAGDRHVVVDIEGPRVEVAVPADDVERMVIEHVAGHRLARLDAHLELAALGVRLQRLRRPQVALAVRGMLQQLAELVAVSARRLDLRRRLDDVETRRPVEVHAPGRPVRQHDIVPRPERQAAELGVHRAAPFMGEPHFIGLGVAIKIAHALCRPTDAQRHVGVAEQDAPGGDRIAAGRHFAGGVGPVAQRAERRVLDPRRPKLLRADEARRQEVMVEDRLDAREPLQPHDLFAVQAAVRPAELDVSLFRELTQAMVEGHDDLLRTVVSGEWSKRHCEAP
ncbi:MAG: hypothetical protein HW404_2424 [Anaerolineales bacterium]|nr:hypothetical protein [Anaerolineales bacterium]